MGEQETLDEIDPEPADLCECGHRFDEHISVQVGANDLNLCCGRCDCEDFTPDTARET